MQLTSHQQFFLDANHTANSPTSAAMSSSSYSTKRRRLNDASSALSRPFKSPLKAAIRPEEAEGKTADASEDQHRENDPAAITDSSRLSTHPIRTPARKPTPKHSSPDHLKKDPQFFALQKQHSALLLQLSKLRQTLETAQQAVQIESSSTDAELETLITKWRLASREAAEEVFRGAKDRVNRMGGVGAWREQSRKKPQGWDEDPQLDLEDLSEEQREQLEIQKEDWEADRRKYAPEKAEEVAERDDDVSTAETSGSEHSMR